MYQQMIGELAAMQGRLDVDPRHIEGYIRLTYGTLDHLSRAQMSEEVGIGIACVDEGGVDMAERTAVSFGL